MVSHSTRPRELVLLKFLTCIIIAIGIIFCKLNIISNADANPTHVNDYLISSIEPIEQKTPELTIPVREVTEEKTEKPIVNDKASDRCRTLIKTMTENKLPSPKVNQYSKTIMKYSKKYNLPYDLIVCMIQSESSFNNRKVSKKGAVGLMQVMAKHHKQKLKQLKINANGLINPDNNINIGCMILSEYYIKQGSIDKALYSYLGGRDKTYVIKILSNMVTHQINMNIKS